MKLFYWVLMLAFIANSSFISGANDGMNLTLKINAYRVLENQEPYKYKDYFVYFKRLENGKEYFPGLTHPLELGYSNAEYVLELLFEGCDAENLYTKISFGKTLLHNPDTPITKKATKVSKPHFSFQLENPDDIQPVKVLKIYFELNDSKGSATIPIKWYSDIQYGYCVQLQAGPNKHDTIDIIKHYNSLSSGKTVYIKKAQDEGIYKYRVGVFKDSLTAEQARQAILSKKLSKFSDLKVYKENKEEEGIEILTVNPPRPAEFGFEGADKTVSATDRWAIQLGSFRKKPDLGIYAPLQDLGNLYIVKHHGYFHVRLGTFNDRNTAELKIGQIIQECSENCLGSFPVLEDKNDVEMLGIQ